MAEDRFPTTLNTWLDRQLLNADQGRARINRHVMEVYAWPLTVYFRGTRDRWLGEPEEMVQGFLADRLDRPTFFSDWQKSGLRLRRWLINAFCFYIQEQKRKRRRDRQFATLVDDEAAEEPAPHVAMDRAFVVAVVRQALADTQQLCREKGLENHLRIFLRHYYDGEPYQSVAMDFGVEPARAAVMARTATRHFKAVLRDLLSCDGAAPREIDREILSLMETANDG